MASMVTANVHQIVAQQIAQHAPRPTDLLTLLQGQFTYADIQDAVAELLDSGEVILDADQHLRIKNAA